jgi:hypothetical protein
MTRTSRARFAALLSTLVLSGIAVLPAGLVLCVAEGDHVAIEGAIELEPCVAPSAPIGLGSETFAASAVESCTDTPLLQAMLGKGSDPRSAPLASTSPWLELPWAPAVTVLRAVERVAAHHGELRALRTVVLRA